MYFRVPLLLQKSLAVIYRLNPAMTKDVRPYSGATSGYDNTFREPVLYDDERYSGTERDTARIEYPPVRVPCQVEPTNADELRQLAGGDMPNSDIQLVLHKQDLLDLKLIDRRTSELKLKVNDRVSRIEAYDNPNKSTYTFEGPGLYIWHLQPASFGFGTDGFDLYIAFLDDRQRGSR